jgi:hypothetical protein
MLAKAGKGIADIQAILGHARATLTDIYLQNLEEGKEDTLDVLKGIK